MSAAAAVAAVPAVDFAGLALAVLAVAPQAVGGIRLRDRAGPGRDAWLAALRDHLEPGTPLRRMPTGTSGARLVGGLDLAATLAGGRPVLEKGLLAEADLGFLVVSMAERLDPWTASLLTGAQDAGYVRIERDGVAGCMDARFAIVALDEGIDEEVPPEGLLERLGLGVDLEACPFEAVPFSRSAIAKARRRLPQVALEPALLSELCAAALAFGLISLRPTLQVIATARILAALHGRRAVDREDAALAAALVLAPRALVLPQPEAPPEQPDSAPDEAEPAERQPPREIPDEVLVETATALLPPSMLAAIAARNLAARRGKSGASGTRLRAGERGRAIGTVPGDPRSGARLGVVETLRAAAPWQKLRARGEEQRIAVRREDFRIVRRRARQRSTTLFVVDASGSSALQRLGEAKGAVQILLAECYIRRDEVALIAFRGRKAELILPPTRALARVSRELSGLAGGGGTPLATAIDTARLVAESIRRTGRTPVIVFMSDARANIGRDGEAGRERAMADATSAAREFSGLGVPAIFIDTALKASPQARALAEAMRARYLPLPHHASEQVAKAVSGERLPAQGARRA